MRNVHLVVDFMYLYYKYYFRLNSPYSKMPRLSYAGEDVTMLYYPLKDIEGLRTKYENAKYEVTVSVCMDSPSDRTSDDSDYKAKRKKVLSEDDFQNISRIQELLGVAGHNVYRQKGMEADDLIHQVVKATKEEFNFVIISSPDSDMLLNVGENVGLLREKAGKGQIMISRANFEDVVQEEMGCYIPYNAILLFKATCGDKSDNVKGIVGFGPKAFDKMISSGVLASVNFPELIYTEKVYEAIKMAGRYLGEEKTEQALSSLKMVAPRVSNAGSVEISRSLSTKEKRQEAYMELGMISLI